jgi:signal transduction histidine kinase
MLGLAAIHVPFLLIVGLSNGEELFHVFSEVALIASAVAAAAWIFRGRTSRALSTSIALLVSSALLVHLTDGLIESHFHFFVMLPLIALYHDWRPFLTAVVFVAVHHGLVGYRDPTAVYNHPAAIANPVKWGLIHAAYVFGLVAVLVFQWRSAERSEVALRDSQSATQRANRVLQAVSECGDALVRATEEGELLGEVCRVVVETGGYRMSWAGLIEEDRSVRPVATRGIDRGYVESLRLRAPDSKSRAGPAAEAISTRTPVTVAEIAAAPDFEQWRGPALERGYQSMIVVPLIHDDRVLGVLAVYAAEPAAFDETAVGTLQMLADDLAYGITALRARAAQHVAEDQLRETLRSKDELIATIAHELRTPLTSVVGFATLLRDEIHTLSADDRADLIRVVAEEGMDLANIVDDLLAAAKMEAGMLSLSVVGVDLRAQTAQVLERWAADSIAHVQFSGDPVGAVGDPARVRQILRNLITNALRYGGDRVHVIVTGADGFASVQVRDSGPGVPPESRDSIFEPYQRGHNVAGVTASLGLGLTISRQLARLMGGDLTYERLVDETVFELTIPRSDTAGSQPAKPWVPERAPLAS